MGESGRRRQPSNCRDNCPSLSRGNTCGGRTHDKHLWLHPSQSCFWLLPSIQRQTGGFSSAGWKVRGGAYRGRPRSCAACGLLPRRGHTRSRVLHRFPATITRGKGKRNCLSRFRPWRGKGNFPKYPKLSQVIPKISQMGTDLHRRQGQFYIPTPLPKPPNSSI